jgi:hypothetical protein
MLVIKHKHSNKGLKFMIHYCKTDCKSSGEPVHDQNIARFIRFLKRIHLKAEVPLFSGRA